MEYVDIVGTEITEGAEVIVQDDRGVSVGNVKKFTQSTVVITVKKPWSGRRQVLLGHTNLKIFVLNKE